MSHYIPIGLAHLSQSDLATVHAYADRHSAELVEALEDMLSGWRYIRQTHGDLYGVGWDRCEESARAALAKARGES